MLLWVRSELQCHNGMEKLVECSPAQGHYQFFACMNTKYNPKKGQRETNLITVRLWTSPAWETVNASYKEF